MEEKYLKEMADKPINRQIEILEKALEASEDFDEILRLNRLLKEKKKLKEKMITERVKAHSAKPPRDEVTPLLNQLDVLVWEGNIKEARKILNILVHKHLKEDEMKRFKEILAELKKKEAVPLISSEPPKSEIAVLLIKLSILVSDPSSLKEARTLANKIRDSCVLTEEEAKKLANYFGELHTKENVEEKREKEKLEMVKRIEELERYKKNVCEKYRLLREEHEKVKKDSAERSAFYRKDEDQRQLIALVLAHTYLKNAAGLLDPKAVQRVVEDYVASEPLANPGHLTTVRNAILTRLDEFIKDYETYSDDDVTL